MGISIYYAAKRSYRITDEENKLIEDIINKYNKEKKFKRGEDFCIYEYDNEDPEAIFSGSTKLPASLNPIHTYQACIYWAKCLTEIRKIVKDAQWNVSMDEFELEWDEEKGWDLPIQ
ncbi:MAG: hypothetical protein LBK44_06675 [Spirochaetales bacterium]|jgi:hypothetical protein|nr:hypothetical protein [Spirochaetales bacterium]